MGWGSLGGGWGGGGGGGGSALYARGINVGHGCRLSWLGAGGGTGEGRRRGVVGKYWTFHCFGLFDLF